MHQIDIQKSLFALDRDISSSCKSSFWCLAESELFDPQGTSQILQEVVLYNSCVKLQGNLSSFTPGITRIHRLPSRPSHPYGRQPHSLIFMSILYKASSRLPTKQLTSDHEPACMCHLYRLRINTHVLNKHHDLCHRATWWQLRLNSKEDICVSLCQLLV